ncbi:alpha/beta hydrolase family protein [Actinokineospora fastidiosa]|uniref:Lipase n=1 Tax=Actinokineospora fastidiosa TaxID=1816 RepID=A0A918GPX1_9PSEU|nr:lipase family protein [Actinokineospora fastidiosa]GGS53232.1 hypothetical protein GCM10010171_55670 [Actinokineospora fastidiosa]
MIRARVIAALVPLVTALVPAQAAAADAPGSVVRIAPLAADRLPAAAASGYFVEYTSTGAVGAPVAVTGTVYLPEGSAPAGGWPVMSWAHGTTGLGDACAPSARPLGGMDAYLSAWLDAGYAVTATDYTGLGTPGGHPYLDGKAQAYGVVDIVRAARSVTPELSPHWLAVGLSQGGHAAVHTAHLATRYAPELDYRGAVGVGVPSNLSGFVSLIGPAFPPSLISGGTKVLVAYILAGLRVADPAFDLDSYLTPLGREVVADAGELCGAAMGERMASVSLADMLTKDLGAPFAQAWGAVFDVPVTGYDRPLLIAQGTEDQTVPQSLTEQLVRDLRDNAQPVTYKTYPAGHGASLTAALADSLAFAETLFEDVEPPADTTAPTATLDRVPLFLVGGAPVTGTAADDRAVTAVTLTFTDLVTGRQSTRQATCADACATWTTPTTGLRGLHAVTATASDAAGNTSGPTPRALALIFS